MKALNTRPAILWIAAVPIGLWMVADPATGATVRLVSSSATTLLPGAVAATVGQSTDGALFNDSHVGTGSATASGSSNSGAGSFVLGSVLASNTGSLLTTQTFAGAVAAAGSTAATFSSARLTGTVMFATAGSVGDLLVTLNPLMTDSGTSLSTATDIFTLDGTPLFYANVSFDGLGTLTPGGSLTAANFVVTKGAGSATAQATGASFDIPITISAAQAGRALAFEFDEAFYASGVDGGASIISPLASPSSLALAAASALLIGCAYRRKAPVLNSLAARAP